MCTEPGDRSQMSLGVNGALLLRYRIGLAHQQYYWQNQHSDTGKERERDCKALYCLDAFAAQFCEGLCEDFSRWGRGKREGETVLEEWAVAFSILPIKN